MTDRPSDISPEDWFPLHELTGRIAALVWVERQLARLFAAWASVEAHHGARIVIATAGRHHQWHGEILAECLATSPELAEQSVPRAPTPGWEAAIETLLVIDEPERTAARLTVIVRELNPWLVRETNALVDVARPIAEGHLLRWLRFVEIDHHDDGEALAALLDAVQSNTVSLGDRSLLASIDLRSPAPSS